MATTFVEVNDKYYNSLSMGKVFTKTNIDQDTQEEVTKYFFQYFGGQDIEVDQQIYQDIVDGKYDQTTYRSFPQEWDSYTTIGSQNTIEDFCAAVDSTSSAVVGMVYLGELTFETAPLVGNAEAVVEIIAEKNGNKTIHIILSSGTSRPYHWEYTYWNNGTQTSGWIGFQPELSSGVGIDISGSTIKAVGVEYKDNTTLQQNALKFVKLTQAEYDTLVANSQIDNDTLYIIYQ